MELIKINPDNIKSATDYLASIGKLQEFQNKKTEASQWSAIILYANQYIATQNQNNQ